MSLALAIHRENVHWDDRRLIVLVLLDLAPASLAIFSSYGLIRKKKWSLLVGCAASGAIIVSAAGSWIHLAPSVIWGITQKFVVFPEVKHAVVVVGIRCLFNFFQITYWVFVVNFLLGARNRNEGSAIFGQLSGGKVIAGLLGGAIGGALVLALENHVLGVFTS